MRGRKPLWMIGSESLILESGARGKICTAAKVKHLRDLSHSLFFGVPSPKIILLDGSTYPQQKTVGLKAFMGEEKGSIDGTDQEKQGIASAGVSEG